MNDKTAIMYWTHTSVNSDRMSIITFIRKGEGFYRYSYYEKIREFFNIRRNR